MPTVAEAEQNLIEQMSVLVLQAMRTGGKNIKLSFQDERTFRCPRGDARRGITVTGRIVTAERKPPNLVTTKLVGVTAAAGLLGRGGYKITDAGFGKPITKLRNASARTNLNLTSPSHDRMTVQGSTDCLKAR